MSAPTHQEKKRNSHETHSFLTNENKWLIPPWWLSTSWMLALIIKRATLHWQDVNKAGGKHTLPDIRSLLNPFSHPLLHAISLLPTRQMSVKAVANKSQSILKKKKRRWQGAEGGAFLIHSLWGKRRAASLRWQRKRGGGQRREAFQKRKIEKTVLSGF